MPRDKHYHEVLRTVVGALESYRKAQRDDADDAMDVEEATAAQPAREQSAAAVTAMEQRAVPTVAAMEQRSEESAATEEESAAVAVAAEAEGDATSGAVQQQQSVAPEAEQQQQQQQQSATPEDAMQTEETATASAQELTPLKNGRPSMTRLRARAMETSNTDTVAPANGAQQYMHCLVCAVERSGDARAAPATTEEAAALVGTQLTKDGVALGKVLAAMPLAYLPRGVLFVHMGVYIEGAATRALIERMLAGEERGVVAGAWAVRCDGDEDFAAMVDAAEHVDLLKGGAVRRWIGLAYYHTDKSANGTYAGPDWRQAELALSTPVDKPWLLEHNSDDVVGYIEEAMHVPETNELWTLLAIKLKTWDDVFDWYYADDIDEAYGSAPMPTEDIVAAIDNNEMTGLSIGFMTLYLERREKFVDKVLYEVSLCKMPKCSNAGLRVQLSASAVTANAGEAAQEQRRRDACKLSLTVGSRLTLPVAAAAVASSSPPPSSETVQQTAAQRPGAPAKQQSSAAAKKQQQQQPRAEAQRCVVGVQTAEAVAEQLRGHAAMRKPGAPAVAATRTRTPPATLSSPAREASAVACAEQRRHAAVQIAYNHVSSSAIGVAGRGTAAAAATTKATLMEDHGAAEMTDPVDADREQLQYAPEDVALCQQMGVTLPAVLTHENQQYAAQLVQLAQLKAANQQAQHQQLLGQLRAVQPSATAEDEQEFLAMTSKQQQMMLKMAATAAATSTRAAAPQQAAAAPRRPVVASPVPVGLSQKRPLDLQTPSTPHKRAHTATNAPSLAEQQAVLERMHRMFDMGGSVVPLEPLDGEQLMSIARSFLDHDPRLANARSGAYRGTRSISANIL